MKKHFPIYMMILTLVLSGCGSRPAEEEKANEPTVAGTEASHTPVSGEEEELPEAEAASAAKELWERSMEYSIFTGMDPYTILDHEGDPMENGDTHVAPIYDVISHDIIYYTEYYTTYEKAGEWDVNAIRTSRLYAPDGELLIDWNEIEYRDGIGDWVTARKYYSVAEASREDLTNGSLLNPRTGEIMEDVSYLDPVGENHVLARMDFDSFGVLMDAQGDPVRDMHEINTSDTPNCDFQVYKDYMYMAEGDYENGFRVTFYDETGEPLGVIPRVRDIYIWNNGIMSPYVSVDNKIYDPSSGEGGELEPLYEGNSITYWDADVYVDAVDLSDNPQMRLYDTVTGKPISEEYTSIRPDSDMNYSLERSAAECFYVVEGDEIIRLNRLGNETARRQMDGLIGVELYKETIVVSVDQWTGVIMLDQDLNVQMPRSKYTYVYPIYDSTNIYDEQMTTGLWIGRYPFGDYYTRADVFDTNGKVIMDGISDCSQWKDGKMAVKRGQTVGLVNMDGEWLSKCPVSELHNGD